MVGYHVGPSTEMWAGRSPGEYPYVKDRVMGVFATGYG